MTSAPLKPIEQTSAARDRASSGFGGWLLILFLLTIAGLAFGLIPRWRERRALESENHELAIATVQVIHATPGKATAALSLPAEIRPFQEAPIYARANGFLKRWYADIGTHVEAGAPLADIDAPELDQQLIGLKAELAQAQAAEALAAITSARWAELLKTSSVSEQENAEKQADLKLKTATVDAAKANVRRLEDLTSFAHVTAPFSGTLTARNVDAGDLITSGKELFRLADITRLRVYVRVPQSATPSVLPGLDAEVTIPEKPAQKFPAKVVRTSGLIDSTSRTLLTELEVENPKNEIIAGSFAEVSFSDVKMDPTLVLPSNALLFRGEGLQVGVVSADGKVELRAITIGRDFGKTVEVLSGITIAESIIVNPTDALTTGSTVRLAAVVSTNSPASGTK